MRNFEIGGNSWWIMAGGLLFTDCGTIVYFAWKLCDERCDS
jgi:hypothetical protein